MSDTPLGTAAGKDTHCACGLEAGRLWSDLVIRHARIRKLGWAPQGWPTRGRWERWAKGRYHLLHSQSVQQIIANFCESIRSTQQLRKNGHTNARYPSFRPRYHQVIYTNQAARITGGKLVLPNGGAGRLIVPIPPNVRTRMESLGRLMEVRLNFNTIQLVYANANTIQVDIQAPTSPPVMVGTPIGIDLGVNTLIAVTDGTRAVLISGREAKATVQWRNKKLSSLQQRQSGLKKGSRRHKRLQRRKYRMLAKSARRMRDLLHKATRIVAQQFPDSTCVIGEPWNDAAQHTGSKQAQQVSSASTRIIINLLGYKTAGASTVNEAWTSQTCPWCGHRNRCGRVYRCTGRGCGISAPRDVVGAINILSIGRSGSIQKDTLLPTTIQWFHPLIVHPKPKYPGVPVPQVVPADTRQVALVPPTEH